MVKKIHFINRIDKENAGDWSCCPLNYYYEYFKQYNIIRHDIDFIDYNEINRNDVVILGGSGLFDVTYSFNRAINKVLDICDNVIAWSAGFNTHDKQWFQGEDFPKINFQKFTLVTIRDYNHPSGIDYLPCPSVFAFEKDSTIKPICKYGIIEHKDLPLKFDFVNNRISNKASLVNIEKFILSSEAIITNSYHCAYWSIILGRKAIVVNKFSTKFDYYKYKPQFISVTSEDTSDIVEEKIEEAFMQARVYNQAYDEAVELNNLFFDKVKLLIEEKRIEKNNDYQMLYQTNIQKLWNTQSKLLEIQRLEERLENMQSIINKQHQEVFEAINHLHDELYGEISKLHDEFYEQMNLYKEENEKKNWFKRLLKNRERR